MIVWNASSAEAVEPPRLAEDSRLRLSVGQAGEQLADASERGGDGLRLAAVRQDEGAPRPRPGVVGVEGERPIREILGPVEIGEEQRRGGRERGQGHRDRGRKHQDRGRSAAGEDPRQPGARHRPEQASRADEAVEPLGLGHRVEVPEHQPELQDGQAAHEPRPDIQRSERPGPSEAPIAQNTTSRQRTRPVAWRVREVR